MDAHARLADRAAYLPAADAVVCADLHLGRDDQSNVELPLGERDRIPARIEALLDRFAPAEVVLAGDVLHAFDSAPEPAIDALDSIHEVAAAGDADLVVLAGNHDAMLEDVLGTAPPAAYRLADDTLVLHGDRAPDASAPRYVIGHDHPAIVIEGQRRPCYLRGPAADRDATVLVLPAFNELARGSPVNGTRGRALASPLVDDVDRFAPAVRDPAAEETLWFPRLGEFRAML